MCVICMYKNIKGKEELDCGFCPNIVCSLPHQTFEGVKKLNISNCCDLIAVPNIEGLIELDCSNCPKLTSIPNIKSLKIINCSNCPSLTSIPEIEGLEKLIK